MEQALVRDGGRKASRDILSNSSSYETYKAVQPKTQTFAALLEVPRIHDPIATVPFPLLSASLETSTLLFQNVRYRHLFANLADAVPIDTEQKRIDNEFQSPSKKAGESLPRNDNHADKSNQATKHQRHNSFRREAGRYRSR